jgi:hypothetical protein
MYAVYHGPDGLRAIARRIHGAATWLAGELLRAGMDIVSDDFFDTVTVTVRNADEVLKRALLFRINLRRIDETHVCIALDERVREEELQSLLTAFGIVQSDQPLILDENAPLHCSALFHRESDFLQQPVFNRYHSETEMMRYLARLEGQRHRAQSQHDPAGFLHHEAECGSGDDAAELARGEWPASLRAGGSDRGLSGDVCGVRDVAGGVHGF